MPVLIVLDSTPNPKLRELAAKFLAHNGEVYIGPQAWEHLDGLAGPTMSMFLEKYVRRPMDRIIAGAAEVLPEFGAVMEEGIIKIRVGDEVLVIRRRDVGVIENGHDEPPDDTEHEPLGP
jgi:hypothetical protein